MSLKYVLALVFPFLPFNLFAQQFVDVFPDSAYIQERTDFDGSGIFKINYDLSIERFLLPPLPRGFSLASMFVADIRPKIRFENFWISDRHKIYKRPLDAESAQEWELVKVPDEIAQFTDFEIISDKEAIICGCTFKSSSEMHFVFNYKTGNVTTTIESLDRKSIPYELSDIRHAFTQIKILGSYICRFNSKVIIVGTHSGFVTILDINPDNGKLRNLRKIRIVPEDEIPEDPQKVINTLKNGKTISWIGPLFGDDVLICCRMRVVPDKNPSEPVITYCFRTLNLRTGKVTFEGASYRGRMAESHLTLYEDNDGELLSARDVINKRLKQIEQEAKKPKSNPAPEKQTDQPAEAEPPKQSKQIA